MTSRRYRESVRPAVALPPGTPIELVVEFDTAPDDAGRARALFAVANHVEFSSRRAAVDIAEQSLDLALAADNPELVVEAQVLLAFQLNECNRSMEAFQHSLEAVALALTFKDRDPTPYLRAVSTRAVIRAVIGDFAGARRDYQTILDVPLGRTDIVTLLVARLNLGSLYIEANRPRRAMHHLSMVAEILADGDVAGTDDPRHVPAQRLRYFRVAMEQNFSDARLQLADSLARKGRTEQIPELLDAVAVSCAVVEQLVGDHDQFNLMLLLMLRCGERRLKGDIEAAVAHGSASVELDRQLGQSVYPQPHIAYARALDAADRHGDAISAWTTAAGIARRAGNSTLLGAIAEEMSHSSERRGDHAAALQLTREALAHSRQTLAQLDELAELEHDTAALDSIEADDQPPLRERLWIAEQQAALDPLTGLLNRRGLSLRLDDTGDEDRERLVALVDIDHFKTVNDTHSHVVGDGVLKSVAAILDDAVPADGLVSRYGGEEFVIVVDNTDEESGHTLLDAVRSAVERHTWTAPVGAITVSIGFAIQNSSQFIDALAQADAALYEAKRDGRNTVRPGRAAARPAR